ncbi:MAG TPA: hypothetical protein VKU82_01025 [Planctomycetaceae bacterium]|nr:hypothetical protein [Planctomycetaceae bacterium]
MKWLKFERKSRVVLSKAGAEFVRPLCRGLAIASADSSASREAAHGTNAASLAKREAKPAWDGRTLMFRGNLLREYTRSAPNEEAILDEFEKSGWMERISVPGYFASSRDRKGQLHNAINALNRKQHVKRIHFTRDGKGHIRWQQIPEAGFNMPGRRRAGAIDRKRRTKA